MQVKNLLADISFKIYVKTPINNNHKHNGEILMMMILFTNHFYFKIQVKNLLADTAFKIYVKTPINNNHKYNGESYQ